MESLQLSISTRLDALLAQRAVEEGKTKAEVVCAALESYLAPQTPLERSLQTLEHTLNDRFDRLERSLRTENQFPTGKRSFPNPEVPGQSNDRGHTGGQQIASELEKAELKKAQLDPEYEEGDEPYEVLSEFLEFASPAIQRLEQNM